MNKRLLAVAVAGGLGWYAWRKFIVVENEFYSNDDGGAVGGFIRTAAGIAAGDIFESDDLMLPNLNMQISTLYLEKVKKAENGIKAGWDAGKQKWFVHTDSAGFATMAYGHKVLATDNFRNGISEPEAVGLLLMDIQERLDLIRKKIKLKLTQGQFDALLDFIYNAGEGSYLGTGRTAKRLGNNIPKAINEIGFDAGFAQITKHYKYVVTLQDYLGSAKGLLNRHEAQRQMAYFNKY